MKSWMRRYGWAVGSVGLACILQTGLYLLPFRAPFLPFFAAVTLTALYAGLYPALLAIALSLVIVNVQFVDASVDGTEMVVVRSLLSGLYVGTCLLLSWLALAQRRHAKMHNEAQARFLAAQEVSPEGFCILLPVLDEKGRVIDLRWQYLNSTLQRMLKRGNPTGLRLSETLPEHRETKWLWRRGLRVLRTGAPLRVEFSFDGGDLKASYRVWLVRLEDGLAVWVNDITERKRAEEALRQSNATLAKAGTMAHFGAWELEIVDPDDFDRSLLRWSDEAYRIFGYEPGGVEVTDALFFRHVHPDDAKCVRKVLAEAVAEKRSYTIEHRIFRTDGTERMVLEHAEVAYDELDRPLRLSGAIQDITERKRAEEELRTFAQRLEERVAERTEELARSYEALRQSERLAAIGQMATALSHESRNAIQNSTAAFEMLRRATDQPRLRTYAEMGLSALKDLRQIHEDVRDYAAPLRLERSTRPLDALWRTAWEDLAGERKDRDAHLVETPSEANLQCDADPLRMKQVFRNLLENALAACSDPVEIGIRVTTAEVGNCPGLCVCVSDNGPGIEPGQSERIFEAFYTTKTKGTGLGLAIVRRIVEAHGGHVELGNDSQRGLEVKLLLPIQAPRAE